MAIATASLSDEPPESSRSLDGGLAAGEGGPVLPDHLLPDWQGGDHLKIWFPIFVNVIC